MTGSPRRSTLFSALLHCAVIAVVVFTTGIRPATTPEVRYTPLVATDISKYLPTLKAEHGGGGGGARDPRPATFGKLPKFAPHQFTPPSPVVMNVNPLLPMEPTLVGSVVTPMATINLPNGDPNGVSGPPSPGPGDGGGIGPGHGTGVGRRRGPGYEGDGDGGGVTGPGAGVRASVTAPIVVYKIEPEYSDEARRARLQGEVLLEIEVNTDGHAQNIHLRQSLGLGLDERAIDAVKQWKFLPGRQNGKPVVTVALVSVTFRLL